MTMTTKVIFDTSAYLALINGEPGSNIVKNYVSQAYMSTVNIAELVSYLVRNGYCDVNKIARIVNLIRAYEYNYDLAIITGEMITHTSSYGLSLGDRACLASAKMLDVPVYTADKQWTGLQKIVGVKIIQIR
ncbi:MAG: hypothetical protein A3F18_05055 [Legionellales bacterium RIFCSPHIGHO2_12_FULL_37_14]|nr:MAG: hypothetical protein A3F18_05055 [Legionellales bacterium RIFCSPHIGHO2_12_FULL_37_14]